MNALSNSKLSAALVFGVVGVVPSVALADVPGFGFLEPAMWMVNYGDTGTTVTILDPGRIEVTSGFGQTRSIFFRLPQDVRSFTASWTYEGRYITGCCNTAGFALVIQNAPDGDEALGGTCGYTGIRPSVAAVFDVANSRYGYWKNGDEGNFRDFSSVNMVSTNPIDITLEYDGNLLTMVAIDTVTGDRDQVISLAGDISLDVGGDSALVGITTATSNRNIVQVFSNFSYSEIASCLADLDFDGELTIFDFLAFQNLFDLGDPRADFDGDGAFTIFDFLAFQNAFDAGCP